MTRHSVLSSLAYLAGLIALASSVTANANDQIIVESARTTDTGQAWFNYLTQCSTCDDRKEALNQLQLKQYEANGQMEIEGAATGTGAGADLVLLERARETGAAQDWYNYLSQCQNCEARGEALGTMQSLQLAANGELELDAMSLTGSGGSGALGTPDIEIVSGDEDALADNAYTHGTAQAWYSYLVGCTQCSDRQTALNAMQQLRLACGENPFDCEQSWTPGETLIIETSIETASEENQETASETIADEAAAEETISENTADEETAEADVEEIEDSAGGEIVFEEPETADELSPEESILADLAEEETASEETPAFDDNTPQGESWELALEISGHSRAVWRVAFSPVAPILASASGDRTVLLYDLKARDVKHRLTAHQGYVNAIAFSPDGKYIASGGGDHAVIIWDANNGSALRILQGHAGDINALAWSASGDLLVSGADDGRVVVWDSASGDRIAEMAETGSDVTAIAISPNEETVATAGSDGHVYLFNTQDGSQTSSLDSHDGYTFDLSWSVDGKRLTAAGSDGVIRQWQLAQGSADLVAQQGHAITGIDFSANGKYIASSDFSGHVIVRDANNFNKVQSIPAYKGSAYSVSMTGDGRYVAAAGGVSFIRVWRR